MKTENGQKKNKQKTATLKEDEKKKRWIYIYQLELTNLEKGRYLSRFDLRSRMKLNERQAVSHVLWVGAQLKCCFRASFTHSTMKSKFSQIGSSELPFPSTLTPTVDLYWLYIVSGIWARSKSSFSFLASLNQNHLFTPSRKYMTFIQSAVLLDC